MINSFNFISSAKIDLIESSNFLVLCGSRLYGYSRKDSDYDYIGFKMPSINDLSCVFNKFEGYKASQEELDFGLDYDILSFQMFVKGLVKNNVQLLEAVFAPSENIAVSSYCFDKLFCNIEIFLSKQLYNRFAGYAYSEFRKIRGVGISPEKQTKTEQTIINDIRNVFRPTKEDMDNVIKLLYINRPKKEVNIYRKLGKKRKASIDKYGYSIKNAANCIRLLSEGIEMLETGGITFPFPEALLGDIIKIRSGEMGYAEVEELYSNLVVKLNEAYEKSSLPATVDIEKIDIFISNMIEEYIERN